MKKVILIFIVCVFLSSVLFAQTKKTVAVLEFEGGSGQDAITLADLFASELANKNVFTILTRTSVNAIMKEHKFQRSLVTDTESIKAIGELLNADYIVAGKIATLGDSELLTVQMINVVTGQVDDITGIETMDRSVPKTVAGSGNISNTTIAIYEGREGIELIKALISRGINATDDNGYTPLIHAASYGYTELVKELIVAGANINAESYDGISAHTSASFNKHKWVQKVLVDAGAEVKTYRIGERGPGGGLVFYMAGGKYLECSDNLGEAKQMGKNYRGGGYSDWYLPSEEELNYIYENLAKKGFIEQTGYFWSSSEGNTNLAWRQTFGSGHQFYSYKTNSNDVRVVRAFNP